MIHVRKDRAMGRKKLSALTDLELDVMNIVWKHGSVTVRQIVEELRAFRPLAYTTVQTVLTILTQKGFVGYIQRGRAYVYRAIVQPKGIREETVNAVVDKLFEGSHQSLIGREQGRGNSCDCREIAVWGLQCLGNG